MAIEAPGYTSQVRPARSTPLPFRDPGSDAGVAIGEGMARIGGELHRGQLEAHAAERRLKSDAEAADFSVRFAQSRAKFDAFTAQQRNVAAPGGEGHAEGVKTAWEAEAATLLEGFSERGNVNAAREQLANYGARLVEGEVAWQEGQRVVKTVTDQQALSDIGGNRARLNPSAYAEELTAGRNAIAALNVPADVRAKLLRAHDQTVTVGFLNGLNDTNPAGAIALIDAGAFNDVLDPQQIEQARAGAMVEVRRADAAAAHQQQLEAAQVRDTVQGLKTQIEGGVSVPDSVLAKAQGDRERIGDQGGATAMGLLRVQNGIRRETEPWTPLQFDTEIAALTGKGAKRSPAEDVRLKTLQSLRPAAVATYNSNPGEWAAKNGMPPPPLDFTDRTSIAQRTQWARVVQDRTGRPVNPLLPAEAATLREQAAASPRGRVEVADAIAQLGGYSTLLAARQIAPNDPMLGRLAQLADPQQRRAAANGAEIRQTRKDVIDGTNGNDASEDFREALGSAGSLMAPADVGAAFEIARNLYAARAEGANYDQALFEQATHQALGGTYGRNGQKLGGIGTHGRNPVLLPEGMSDATFDKTLARFGAAGLRGPNRPVWADKTPMEAADLAKFIAVRRPDGLYEFHDGSGAKVTVKDGRTWTLDVARFAREAGIVEGGR